MSDEHVDPLMVMAPNLIWATLDTNLTQVSFSALLTEAARA